MRPLALLLFLCACSSLASEDQTRLTAYQRNAQLFFDGGKWSQAMTQIERGLELAPDDYKLNSMKGGILLLASGDAQGTDHKKLDEATALLAEQFDTRSVGRHEPHLLLNYGLALQKQGLRHLGEAVRLEGQLQRTPAGDPATTMREQATKERGEAGDLLQRADDLLAELVSRGEMLRLAHNHRLQIALQRGDEAGFARESTAYLEQAEKAQTLTRQRLEKTQNIDYENEQLAVLRQLRDEELRVRALIAEFHYSRRQFAPALVQLNKVLEIDPGRFIDYYNRGRVLLELGRAEDAKQDFRRFLADPSIPTTSDKAVFALKAIDR